MWSGSPENSTEEGTPELAHSPPELLQQGARQREQLTRTCLSPSMQELRVPASITPFIQGRGGTEAGHLPRVTGQVGRRGTANLSS